MAKAASIALLSLLPISIFAFPAPQDNPEATSSKFQWQIWKSCPQESKDAIFRAWEDSKRLSDALKSWKPNADYQTAMEMWMGDRCTYSDLFGFDFPRQITDTARRSRGLYDGVSEYGTANLWVYCNEDSKWWKTCNDKTSVVLAYEQEDHFFNNWYITFCPAFYDPEINRPLDTVIQEIKDRHLDPKIMEYWYGVQGATFFHETMHMSQLVTSPQAGDKAYGPKLAYELARNRNTDAAVYNADSWMMTAQAIFAQQEMDLDGPPYPYEHPPKGVTVGDVGDLPDHHLESVVEKVDGFVPEGAGDNPVEPWFVNPDLWEIYGAPPPPPPEPTKGLAVLADYTPGADTFTWVFFATEYGQPVDCRTDTATAPKEVPWSDSGETFPEGPWDLDLGGEKCQYTSDNNPGTLVCGDKTIPCIDDPADTDPGNPLADKGEYDCGDKKRQPVFICGPY